MIFFADHPLCTADSGPLDSGDHHHHHHHHKKKKKHRERDHNRAHKKHKHKVMNNIFELIYLKFFLI